ncbi:MAG: DUF1573 domain-containing protein [Bacteroidetes bacterium]|nr:DUF1573 domain-containing protein [Bacteroidota bacterium]
MKKLFTALFIGFIAITNAAFAQDDKKVTDNGDGPNLQLVETSHDFGNIEEGPDYTYIFKFKNIGKAPLALTSVNSPCGCTAPSFTKEPVAPGKTGEITVVYHSSGRIGSFNRTLSISSNMGDGKDQYINIKGEVKAKGEIKTAPVVETKQPVVAPVKEEKKSVKSTKTEKKKKS